MIRALRAAALAAAGMAVAVAVAAPASAHSTLVSTVPAAGGTLPDGQAPELRFSEPVVLAGSTLDAVALDGTVVPLVPIAHLGADTRTLTVAPAAVPRLGPVTVRWAALAEDGHRSQGSFTLTLPRPAAATLPVAAGAGGGGAPVPDSVPLRTTTPATGGLLGRAFTATRSAGYLAITVLCGGLAFLALAWPEGAEVGRVRRLLWSAWTVGVVTSLAGAGMQAAYAGHLGFGSAFRPSVVVPGFDTRAGLAWASRGLLFLLAVPVLAGLRDGADSVRSAGWRVGTAAVAVGLLRTPGLVAHGSEGRMAWLGSIADTAHLVGVAVWLGGLVVLCSVVLPRRRPDELRRIVPRFSSMAGVAVAVVVVAGAFLSWQLVGSFGALTGTRFGHVLLVKLALVAGIAAAGLRSHRWAAGRLDLALASTDPSGDVVLRPFVVSVATEVALAVAVLTVASVLVATSPGR